jgi:hypothetical protein
MQPPPHLFLQRQRRPRLRLTFAPMAWLKLQYFCHAGSTEVGGFGIASVNDLLYVEDFVTVEQQATSVSVRFLDEAVADFFDRCVDAGLAPQRFGRIWCHTHPGASVTPSSTDEQTFARSFGSCDWSVLFILGRTSNTYARLSFAAGPGGHLLLPTAVDWAAWPASISTQTELLAERLLRWRHEYAAHIHALPDTFSPLDASSVGESGDAPFWRDRDLVLEDGDDREWPFIKESGLHESLPGDAPF